MPKSIGSYKTMFQSISITAAVLPLGDAHSTG